MRSIPHAVVVLTTTTKTSKPPYSVYRGMTLSSFTTLTLTPSPIVTFNIRQPSRTLNAIKKSKHFLIHILSATASGARVADAFTKGNDADVFARDDCFRVQKEVLKENGSSYPGLELPRLEADGVLKVLRCEVLDAGLSKDRISGLVQVGDHVLLLAKVHEILEATKSSNEDEAKEASNGLFYADGRYRKVGDVIEHEEKVSGDETSA
jgi:flavin reductase (DIM6/NTAB) family NADH-FMN oxidoreductase RutF